MSTGANDEQNIKSTPSVGLLQDLSDWPVSRPLELEHMTKPVRSSFKNQAFKIKAISVEDLPIIRRRGNEA